MEIFYWMIGSFTGVGVGMWISSTGSEKETGQVITALGIIGSIAAPLLGSLF